MIRAKVVGAGGYGGVGLVELLLGHPEVKITTLAAAADVGVAMSELWPHLRGFCDQTILSYEDPRAKEPADVVFFATPDGVGMRHAEAELATGARVIDFSGDFRFQNAARHAEYARLAGRAIEHTAPHLLGETVYGLPELDNPRLGPNCRLVGNAGCFAVSVLLGLAPAAKYGLIRPERVIADCKTAVSGAGKKPQATYHYPARYENMNAYRLSGHQHVCEIEDELRRISGENYHVLFTAQVVPMCRGILSCLYGELREGVAAGAVMEAYREYHRNHPFVRIFDRSASVGTAHVRGSNFAHLVVDVDERTRTLRVISHIDNLVKGQAGNAVQNMNILFGLPATTGLWKFGVCP
ncbi:MAG: N-acetyl-gamma-glutamyl-phosphate reductase [Kiritimatiellae bacterium]|nr:N-acetyl-gamma-glutamyl-phosphate reductase [Kiritimatiellia bacterium]